MYLVWLFAVNLVDQSIGYISSSTCVYLTNNSAYEHS